MKEYYQHWERRVYLALSKMVVTNLQFFESMLGNKTSKKRRVLRKTPLFKVSASLSAPEIVINPLAPEIYKMMIKLTRSIVDSTRQFHRWQNGTCIITPPLKTADEEDPVIFSFHSDILNNQTMVAAITQLNSTITKAFGNLSKWLDYWRKYRPLWKVDKVVTLEKFVQKKPSIVNYDEKLTFYSKLSKDIDTQSPIKDIDFIRVIYSPLQAAIQSEASSWVAAIGIFIFYIRCAFKFAS